MSCSSELERAGGLTGQDPKPVGEGGEDRFIYCLSCTRCWYGTCYIQAECFIFYLQFSLPIVLRGFLLSMTSRARPGQAGPGRANLPANAPALPLTSSLPAAGCLPWSRGSRSHAAPMCGWPLRSAAATLGEARSAGSRWARPAVEHNVSAVTVC